MRHPRLAYDPALLLARDANTLQLSEQYLLSLRVAYLCGTRHFFPSRCDSVYSISPESGLSTVITLLHSGLQHRRPLSELTSHNICNHMAPRCVLSGSCPQFLDAPLRTIQMPVDQERVGVGRYLRRDPGGQPHQRGGQRLAQAEDPLEAGD